MDILMENADMTASKPNYKIYFFADDHYTRVTVEKFCAENDDAAYAHLLDMRSRWPNREVELYYKTICYTSCIDDKGNRSPEVDMDEHHVFGQWIYANDPWYKKMWEEVKEFFEYWLVTRPKDFYYWLRDLIYLLKNKEAYSNQWNLDMHLLESIERNVPSLIKNSHSLAFFNEAIIKLHGDEPGFDLDKYLRAHCSESDNDETEKLAIEIQNEEYSKLLLYVKLYKYYSEFGCIDFDNPDEVEFDREWRHTLPIKKGTYDEISDYSKLIAMVQEQWEAIWDWMKKHGQKLCD